MTDIDKLMRWRSTATTWTGKTTDLLLAMADDNEHARGLAAYEARRLMDGTLWRFEALVPLLDEEDVEDLERDAKALVWALRARRLADALSNTEGRTNAETEAFAAKASELRLGQEWATAQEGQ